MSHKIPNVHLDAEVPATFGRLAKRLGFEPRILLWYLAADLLARPPKKINIIKDKPKRRKPMPKNVVPFPDGEEAA